MKKVSIVIPAYNEEKNIERLLKSITGQTYADIEIIVVDDGSTDATASLSKKYTNLVFTRKSKERSTQRNFGASKAKGVYLLFLDADMELEPGVIQECVDLARRNNIKALTIPERTVGENFFARVRNFERKMYMGDATIEVARFFDTKVFHSFGGYDPKLTGPEDYDLPYRISKDHKIGRTHKAYILHHEETTSLPRMLRKKYYYAYKGASYAAKHPELVGTQGNLLFRRAYARHWRNFFREPILAISFIIIRVLEMCAAVLGFIRAVGIKAFLKTLYTLIK